MSLESQPVLEPMAYSVARVSRRFVEQPQLSGWRRLVKSVVEREIALISLVLLAPLMAALMLLIRLETPGRAIIKQVRLGEHGRPFGMYKFRTTTVGSLDAEAETAALGYVDVDGWSVRMRRDPRLTRTGWFLRRYSLDELPQLLNVVRGEMSLVGPRPRQPHEVSSDHPEDLRPLLVRPGVTGLAQVAGFPLSPDQSRTLDVAYLDNWSLGLDLRILLRTAFMTVGEKDA